LYIFLVVSVILAENAEQDAEKDTDLSRVRRDLEPLNVGPEAFEGHVRETRNAHSESFYYMQQFIT
jgi:hypothetical protein